MKILVGFCNQCAFEGVQNHNVSFQEITDEGIYKYTCSKGHEVTMLLGQEKFELLFEMGAMALIDGYPREAVTSFAASLERFYEFFIRVIIEHKQIDFDEFQKTWKLVKVQSERQLGAFYFLYLNEFKQAPPKLHDDLVKFRNDVTHKGLIPKYDEVINYSKKLFEYMSKILSILKEGYSDSIRDARFKREDITMKKHNIQSSGGMSILTMLSSNETFEEAFEQLKRRAQFIYSK
ncbi:hypothetical protein [Bacillus licheniformis]|uniref:hypothetical protein n=1 Tax=Bacillus TaxID=1386 RepID=UPI002DB68DA8|nr:hypothetical protein [Bacillus licheniformis]MEC0715335.1 hypothetical protein [Bacillus licheniformis]